MECGICFEIKECNVTTMCQHSFCVSCIAKVDQCPMCRKEIMLNSLMRELKRRPVKWTMTYKRFTHFVLEEIVPRNQLFIEPY